MLPDPGYMTRDSTTTTTCTVCVAVAIVVTVAFVELPTGLFLATGVCFVLLSCISYALLSWGMGVDEEDGLEESRTPV